MFKNHKALEQMVSGVVAEFLNRYDGYEFHVTERHDDPTTWSEGKQTLTVTITCQTGEPTLPREAQS